MFSSGPNYTKLKTNLRLAITRLKLLEKKKSELTEKSRREIADYISAGKYERAKIRVEFIIRINIKAVKDAKEPVILVVLPLMAYINKPDLGDCLEKVNFNQCQLRGYKIELHTSNIYSTAADAEQLMLYLQNIQQEDYFVEALEIVEMYCDLLLARFGLIQNMKELDEGIAEAVSSIIWVAPRLQSDVQEIKVIADLLAAKYGPQYAEACRIESVDTISPKLKHKLSIQSPPKLLVEKYVIEIASVFNINYEPDPQVMALEQGNDAFLIDLSSEHKNNLGGGGGGNGGFPQPLGFVGYPQPPGIPSLLDPPAFSYPMNPGPGSEKGGGPSAPMPFNYNIPPQNHPEETKQSNTDFMDNLPTYSMVYPDVNKDMGGKGSISTTKDNNINENTDDKPKPLPRTKMNNDYNLPDLPSVPNVAPGGSNDADDSTVDFDDLTRRFNELKKRM